MAKVSRWAIFIRAFLMALLAGAPARVGGAEADEVAAWSQATAQNSAEGYFDYLSRYPTGEYAALAITALIRLGALPGVVSPSTRGFAPDQVAVPDLY